MPHTPGPWTVTQPPRPLMVLNPEGVEVADCSELDSEDSDEANANARLISAAPDLLEAAMYAFEMLGQSVPDGNQQVSLALRLAGMGGKRAESLLRAAITKARGTTL